MSASEQYGFTLEVEIADISCFYFCSQFYEAFKDITDNLILKNHKVKKALCYCSSCEDKIKRCLKTYYLKCFPLK